MHKRKRRENVFGWLLESEENTLVISSFSFIDDKGMPEKEKEIMLMTFAGNKLKLNAQNECNINFLS